MAVVPSVVANFRKLGIEVVVESGAGADAGFPDAAYTEQQAAIGTRTDVFQCDIVAQVNKRSINWLADRVVMTAAARAYGGLPSMQLGIEAMYKWLETHTTYDRDDLLVDTGSGLSRQTQLSAHQIVDVLRAASGLATDSAVDESRAHAYLASLSIAGTDGTLRRRLRNTPAAGHLHGKTGTLRDVVALSGILDVDPERPLVFALVTNGHPESLKVRVKRAHEDLVRLLCDYVKSTAKPAVAKPAPIAPKVTPSEVPAAPKTTTAPIEPPTRDGEDIEETDVGAPEVSPDREDIEYMAEQEQAGPIVAPPSGD